MVKISKKLKELSSIGVADVIVAGISAIFWIYIASTIGPDGYGHLTYLIAIANLAATVSLLGSNRTLMVYPAKGVQIQSTLYVLTLASGLISSVIVFVFLYNLGTSFLVFALIIYGLTTAELVGRRTYVKYAKYLIVQRILMIGLAIGFYNIFGEDGIIPGIALSYSPFLIEIIKGFRKYKIDFSLIRQKFEFIRNSYLETLSGAFSGSLDKLIIAPIFGFAILGNYSLGLQFYTLLSIIPLAATKYLIPEQSSGSENKKIKKYVIIFSIISAILGFTIGPTIISSMFPKFLTAHEVIMIISWAVIPSTIISVVYIPKFLSMEKSKIVLFGSLSWIITEIIGIIILGNYFGTNGIAASLFLASIVSLVFYYLMDKKSDSTLDIDKKLKS